MPLLPFAPAPSSGSSSPLTTKGDLFTHSTVDTRLAVGGTDGFLLEADSSQTTGLGWGTHDANLNNKNIVNAAGVLVGTTTFPTATTSGLSIQGNSDVVSNGTSTVTFSAANKSFFTWLANDTLTFGGNQSGSSMYGMAAFPQFTASQGRTDESATGIASAPVFAGTDIYSALYGLQLNATIQASATNLYGVYSNLAQTTANTTTTVNVFYGTAIRLGGTWTTLIGLNLTSLSGGSTTWGFQIGNYQSFHQGRVAFGSNTAPTYGIDLQALNGGNTSVIGVAGTNSAPASNPPSNSAWEGLWKGATNYYWVYAFNDAGTMRFTSIGPLQGASVPTIAKGTSLPA